MTDSIHNHQHLGKQDAFNKENPSRGHVERTRDVFKESKPAAANEDTQKEPKMQSRRAEQQTHTKAHKRKSAEAKEKEELSADEQKAKDLAEHESGSTFFVEDTILIIIHFCNNREIDDDYEYRHVTLPKEIAQWLPHYDLLSEDEWRSLGVRQSLGWEHYMVHSELLLAMLSSGATCATFQARKRLPEKGKEHFVTRKLQQHPPKKSKQGDSNASNEEDDTENKESYSKKPRRN
ncbi:hypothetical protein INT43_000785 [Umbelopsis isabellina]|uniref:Cyclin-dependent kinases regulatory subunit n=1 Tax=Mortierella isabellina TaxID=91625 RepID=A0A8H7Q2D9_MORIS|nr:hypothetical protein INT43_000785 [Umbelopsis isabellina]